MAPSLSDRLTGLHPIIERICKASGVPGLSLGVMRSGKAVHRFNHGFSDIDGAVVADSDTVYGIGSITKTFTATALAQLVATGKLHWTTRIKDVLPEFRSQDLTVANEATIEDLLTHRMALARSNNWWYGSDGHLLLSKEQTLLAYAELKPIGPFRAQFDYSNWHYALAGEIIERVSRQSYGAFIQHAIAGPLGLKHTTALHSTIPNSQVAKPYVALDDGSFHRLPQPKAQSGTIMGSAQGILSSVNDLLDYGDALLRSTDYTKHSVKEDEEPGHSFEGIKEQLSGHMFTSRSLLESSYGLGVYRHQLPGSISGTGANGMFLKSLPQIVPGGEARLVISHPGSLAGYTSFFVLLPEIDTVAVILTNYIGFADPAGWIAHIIVEALVDSPYPVDIMAFVDAAAANHIESYSKLQATFDELAANSTVPESLEDYVDTYRCTGKLDSKIVIRLVDSALQVAFQGLESQVWDLKHLEDETFHWLSSRDDQAKKAKFTYPFLPSLFKIVFRRNAQGRVSHLIWAHDAAVPMDEQRFELELPDMTRGPSSL